MTVGEGEDAATGTTVEVVYVAGSELPSTGGVGTVIFYIAGGLLVCAAAVLLIVRRRMSRAR